MLKLLSFSTTNPRSCHEDQSTQWGMKGEKMMKPKSRGAGIMVSDEHNGFLALSDAKYERAKVLNPPIY